jgi:hypothetical protein
MRDADQKWRSALLELKGLAHAALRLDPLIIR